MGSRPIPESPHVFFFFVVIFVFFFFEDHDIKAGVGNWVYLL